MKALKRVETSFYASFVKSVFARNVISSVSLRSEYKTMCMQLCRGLQKCKEMILHVFKYFAKNIDCGHVIPRKASFALQLEILYTKQRRSFWRKMDIARKTY